MNAPCRRPCACGEIVNTCKCTSVEFQEKVHKANVQKANVTLKSVQKNLYFVSYCVELSNFLLDLMSAPGC